MSEKPVLSDVFRGYRSGVSKAAFKVQSLTFSKTGLFFVKTMNA